MVWAEEKWVNRHRVRSVGCVESQWGLARSQRNRRRGVLFVIENDLPTSLAIVQWWLFVEVHTKRLPVDYA